MRLLAISLLLAVAIAQDLSPLAAAVGRFGDDRPGVRQDASAEVHRHLEGALRPLLEAMASPDPEVRRRAVEALRAFLPREPEGEPEEELPLAGGAQVIVVNAAGGNNIVIRQGRQRWQQGGWAAVAGVAEKDIEALRKFGLEGHAVADETMRRQLRLAQGRGFQVRTVVDDSPARALGVRTHDIILRVGEGPVMKITELVEALGEEASWPHVRLRVLRDGEVVDLPADG